MITLRVADIKDYEEIVAMYKELVKEVFKGFELGEDIFFYGIVSNWFKDGKDVVVSVDNETLTGFSLAYVEDLGMVKPYYQGDIIYVKDEYRKGRSAYLLYNNGVDYADSKGLPIIAKAYVGGVNKIDKIMDRFGEPLFVEYKRLPQTK